ncbi:MAG TPA: discoidin domain-containing protein, partial [Phycisphaerae bacterium]|nr:discoidin domain-containing protein [Phycisphaerae bacterium]
ADQDEPAELLAVPYYAWDHRQAGPMAVWIAEDRDLARMPPEPTAASLARAEASFAGNGDGPAALSDQVEPKNSNDHDIPRFTWWDHRGTAEWVQYTFDKPRRVAGVSVYWFDDKPRPGQCRVPKSWRLVYRDGEAWKPVAARGEYGTAIDRYNEVAFEPVQTDAIRIEVQLQPGFSGGILEWKVSEAGK